MFIVICRRICIQKNTSFNKILLKYHNVDINHLSVVHVFMETDIVAILLIDIYNYSTVI